MASTISSRPSHYDALGLQPTASQDEIARAFARAMGVFGARSAAAAARIGLAFETLRNPDKRRAYDESLGLRREPRPAPVPMAVSFRISAPAQAVEPHVEPAPDPGPASFIASSLSEIARPVELDPPARPAAQPEPPPAPDELLQDSDEAEVRPIDWRRPAVAVGAIVLAAGLVGALAGISVRGDEQGQAAVTAPLPAARTRPQSAAVSAAQTPVVADTASAAAPTVRAQPGKRRAERLLARQPAAVAAAADPSQADPGERDAAAAQPQDGQPAADPLAPAADSSIQTVAAADLPLASRLVARTIDRIGYACGEVASTSAVDGAAGVYKVTCTSGQSYRAAPVHGRYRFRRWGSR